MSDVTFRPANARDLEHVQWALYEALDWSPDRQLPGPDVILAHPQAAIYHHGWGRPGDLGVIAEDGGTVVGVVFCRLFTDDEHGHGYVDAETPELGIAVHESRRGEGLGAALMTELADLARATGIRRLSLSVETENPARRLYERLGYREVSRDDEGGIRMVLDL